MMGVLKKRLAVVLLAVLGGAGVLAVAGCGSSDPEVTVSDLEGTWTGTLSGYEKAGYRDAEVTWEIAQTKGNAFKATPTWTEPNGKTGRGAPSSGYLEPSENDFWVAGDDGYCLGEVEADDELELICLEAGVTRDDKLAIGGTLRKQ